VKTVFIKKVDWNDKNVLERTVMRTVNGDLSVQKEDSVVIKGVTYIVEYVTFHLDEGEKTVILSKR